MKQRDLIVLAVVGYFLFVRKDSDKTAAAKTASSSATADTFRSPFEVHA